MLSSKDLKKIVAEARPLIEQQLDLTEQVAGLREVVTAAGGDWSQLKALVKAQIQDERDDAGDGKRVKKILDKADYAQGYAGMLGMSKMNEQNYFAGDDDELAGLAALDPTLLQLLIDGSKSEAGLALIRNALALMQGDDQSTAARKDVQRPTGAAHVASEADREIGEVGGRTRALPAGTQAPPVDTISETHDGEPSETLGTAAEPTGEGANDASPAPAKRQWKHADKAHADCLNPSQCGGFSNLGLCPGCKEAAAQGQVA
jgi:hypothetical protein